MPVEGLLPEPEVAEREEILIQTLVLILFNAEPKFTVTGVLANMGPVASNAGVVAMVVKEVGAVPVA